MKILLADDDHSLRRVIQFKLEQKEFRVTAVGDGRQALEALRGSDGKGGGFDLMLADIRMPHLDGIQLLEQARLIDPHLKVILMTAHATVSQAVQAVKLGAFDYLTKPFEDEQLFVAIEQATKFQKLEDENKTLKGRLRQKEKVGEMIGSSQPFLKMVDLIDKVASTDATVLVTGPSGTGKELVARAIHARSARSDKEFVAVNCAAIPHDLLESELFGHVRGAFTGAVRDKKGKFELADRGSLLLDEIGDLAIDLQAKLLRIIQDQQVEPIGSEDKKTIDVRLIAATNLDLWQRVEAGQFREDLYYRLNVIPIAVPALSQRKDDIPLLINSFLSRHSAGAGITVSKRLMDYLLAYSWPGNIRELENLIERMVVLRHTDILTPDDLPEEFGQVHASRRSESATSEPDSLDFHDAEKQLIVHALKRNGWNRTRAARFINVSRHILIYRMKKYGIVAPE